MTSRNITVGEAELEIMKVIWSADEPVDTGFIGDAVKEQYYSENYVSCRKILIQKYYYIYETDEDGNKIEVRVKKLTFTGGGLKRPIILVENPEYLAEVDRLEMHRLTKNLT